MHEAILSVLTKFDSPAAFFDRDERKAFTALLMQEVLQSGDLPASLVSDKQGKKRVMGAVNKNVGQEFGVWKRAQMTTSST
eukprot:COSAG01_NODE_5252_length_4381_cov_2.023343_4_plen_81_part_00